MSTETLPAVASRVYTVCKKCDAERYHIVLAHTTVASAKVECEVCHSKKTLKLKSAKALAKPRAVSGAAAKKKSLVGESRRNAHNKEYDELMTKTQGEASKYNMKMKFSLNQKIDHPKFGLGIVKMSQPEKIEVIFSDVIRLLVHNRQ